MAGAKTAPEIIVTSVARVLDSDGTYTDHVLVKGSVDSNEVSASAWYSHMYPSAYQHPDDAARGCQTDEDRTAYLQNCLLTATGKTLEQTADLQKFISKPTSSKG